MKLFSKQQTPTDVRFDELLEQVTEVKATLAELKGDSQGLLKTNRLQAEVNKLTESLTKKQIEFDREQEKWDREKRETEHLVGLQMKRSEFESESAARDAKLTVREENLEAQQKRFDEHVLFIEKRFGEQFKSLTGLMEKFLERMPTTKQLIQVGGRNGDDDTNA